LVGIGIRTPELFEGLVEGHTAQRVPVQALDVLEVAPAGDLLERLKDADYAAEYLAQVLAENDKAAFLVALKDVVEATGGMSVMAKRVGLKRPSLYKVFSKRGNPTLDTLQAILEALGLRVTIATAKTA
jgi:probable addiction module antidote protein